MVISGVVIKNSEEQLEKPPSIIGPAVFLMGWLVFAYAVAHNAVHYGMEGVNALLPYGAASVIALSVLAMKAKMAGKSVPLPQWVLQGGFIFGWLLLAFSIGRHQDIAFVSALLVFLSMMVVLPKQRALNLVDGPGMPLFTAAWAGMVYANAL